MRALIAFVAGTFMMYFMSSGRNGAAVFCFVIAAIAVLMDIAQYQEMRAELKVCRDKMKWIQQELTDLAEDMMRRAKKKEEESNEKETAD